MLFYKHVFKCQRFYLRFAYDIVEISDTADHFIGFIGMGGANKIACYTVFELFGFSNVNDLALGVFQYIDTRKLRQ